MNYTITVASILLLTTGLLLYFTYTKCQHSYHYLITENMPEHATEAKAYFSLLGMVYLFFTGYMVLNILSNLTSLHIKSITQAVQFWVDTTSTQLFVMGLFFVGYMGVLFSIKSLLEHKDTPKEPW